MQNQTRSVAAALGELLYPLTSLAVIIPLLVYNALLTLAAAAGMLGIWLYLIVLPSLTRFLMTYVEARAKGQEPETPGIEHFSWFSTWWSLFPLLLGIGFGVVAVGFVGNPLALWLLSIAFFLVFPAVIIVLTVTYSPLQSINPLAWWRVLKRCGPVYLLAPATFGLIYLVYAMLLPLLPALLAEAAAMYILVIAFGVTGAVVRHLDLFQDIDIDYVDEDPREKNAQRLALRESTLSHAYGFASRGNTEGALAHLLSALDDEPDPRAARSWYFEHMLRWDTSYPALKLAQTILSEHLAEGDAVAATKLMLRCRLLDSRFLPLAEDIPAAVEAAEQCDNQELAKAISHGRWQGGPTVVR